MGLNGLPALARLPCPALGVTCAVTQNAFGELCALQKVEGCGMTPPQLMRCIRLATQKVGSACGACGALVAGCGRRMGAAHPVAVSCPRCCALGDM